MKVDVILPAGGRIAGEFAEEAGASIKALIRMDGQALLERTIGTLRSTGCVERAVVIGPEEFAGHPAARGADAVLTEGASGPENLYRGIAWLREHNGGRHADRVLVVATDLPFLSADAVRGFLDACPPEMAICVPALRRQEFDARFPFSRNLYVRLRDGEWTIGCAFLIDPAAMEANRASVERIFQARKSQLGMVRLLGPLFIAGFALRLLTVDHIARRCSQILGCPGGAVLGCAPELAYDIDQPEEYRYALRHAAPTG